ncbi:hypothetical protein [Streptomyces sp. NPDC058812]|uniref:hypothetical protein n=1 Tax=unclassified Streptomyces TaxID=2593676 RepID=UPI0036880186
MTNQTTAPEPREPDNPAAWALAQHIADHPMSTVQAAFRYLNAPLTVELHEQPASAVPLPPADQTPLRERYATAIHDAMEADLSLVDQEPAYQALIARAAEAAVALADAERTAAPVCICGHPEERHFEDVCQTCGCGDYLEPRDAAEVIDRWRQAALKAPVDRAAVLREAADIAEEQRQFEPAFGARKSAQVSENVGILRVAEELRRMADETTATETPAPHRPVSLATPCTVCGHPYNWHTRRHGQCEFAPAGQSGCGCTGFVPGERPEPMDPSRILGVAPDFTAATQTAALSPTERTMLGYALDQAQERIWSEDGFTDEDQAALDSLRRLAAEEPAAGVRQDGAQ